MENLLYIQNEIDRLSKLKAGMIANPDDWIGSKITPATIQLEIDALVLSRKNVLDTVILLHQYRVGARSSAVAGATAADIIDLKVKGVYADNSKKWAEYGIDSHDSLTEQKKSLPAKGMIKDILDDTDNAGFIIVGEPLSGIDVYEWEKGIGIVADPKLIPVFVHLITNKRAKIVDDNVQPGIRYFYRYRGFSSAGYGDWSEPSSKIQ